MYTADILLIRSLPAVFLIYFPKCNRVAWKYYKGFSTENRRCLRPWQNTDIGDLLGSIHHWVPLSVNVIIKTGRTLEIFIIVFIALNSSYQIFSWSIRSRSMLQCRVNLPGVLLSYKLNQKSQAKFFQQYCCYSVMKIRMIQFFKCLFNTRRLATLLVAVSVDVFTTS